MHRLEVVNYSQVSKKYMLQSSLFQISVTCELMLRISNDTLQLVEGRAVAYEPLSSNFDWKKIQEELQEMGESINCDVEFEEVYEL